MAIAEPEDPNPSTIDGLLADPSNLRLYFQPVVSFDGGAIVAAEALLRAHVDGVDMAPPTVVHSAIQHERLRDLGRWVMDEACRHASDWQSPGEPSIEVMVNVDANELLDPDLHRDITASLTRYGLPAELLSIEITETALIEDSPIAETNLSELKALGVGLALDDFGTGYASLSHLRSVPLTTVKLDRVFVSRVDLPGPDHEIVRSVIRLAHALGLKTIAEGVESEGQRAALAGLGCEAWQGFLKGPAVSPVHFLRDLADDRAAASGKQPGATDPGTSTTKVDSFVLRRVAADRWVHLGGAGRGAGWAGILEIDLDATPVLIRALDDGYIRVCHEEPRWLFGAYYTAEAVAIQVDGDTVVVFGAPLGSGLDEIHERQWFDRARELARTITSISPAKRLADELELSEAVQTLVSNSPATLDEAMRHVVDCVTEALSCEFGVFFLGSADRVTFSDQMVRHPSDDTAVAQLGDLAASITQPKCIQDASSTPFPLTTPDGIGVRSWLAIPTAPQLGGLILCAHTDRGPRGFTTLCQRVGSRLADASELILHAAIERERLHEQAAHASTMAHFDALTGLRNRRGWNQSLSEIEPGTPVSVMILDANNLKVVNDRDGHAAGDELLMTISRCLESVSRATDVVARLGGDEFGALLPGADHRVALRVEQQFLEVLRLEQITNPHLSVAHGVASGTGTESLESLICSADGDMYRRKQAMKSTHQLH